MTATTAELRPLLKRLKLGPMLDTLPERIALARRDGLDYADFLQIVLADEVSRRDHGRLELRLRQAGFEQLCRLEDFDWSAHVAIGLDLDQVIGLKPGHHQGALVSANDTR